MSNKTKILMVNGEDVVELFARERRREPCSGSA